MIIFDVDDTLIDHRTAERQAAHLFHHHHRAELGSSADDFFNAWHTESKIYFTAFMHGTCSFAEQGRRRIRAFFNPALNDQAADALFEEYLVGYRHSWALFPDVRSCLDALDGQPLSIISNSSTENSRQKLVRTGIVDRFLDIVTSETARVPKPDPHIFELACQRLNVAPADCVYIGDQLETDARAAQMVGMRGIWLNRYDAPVVGVEDVTIIDDLRALPELLLQV